MLDKGTCMPVFQALRALSFGSDGVFLKLTGFSFRGHSADNLLGGLVKTKDDLGLMCFFLPGRVRWAMHNCLKIGEAVA